MITYARPHPCHNSSKLLPLMDASLPMQILEHSISFLFFFFRDCLSENLDILYEMIIHLTALCFHASL